MTAEVVIANKEAIVLAADSAVTFSISSADGYSNQKTSVSANKIFSLSNTKPIAIMFSGNAAFMGVPWETIVKIFRNTGGNVSYGTLDEYLVAFKKFLLRKDLEFADKGAQYRYINNFSYLVIGEIWYRIQRKTEELSKGKPLVEPKIWRKAANETIQEISASLATKKNKPILQPKLVKSCLRGHYKVIDQIAQKELVGLVQKKQLPVVRALIEYKLGYSVMLDLASEIVIAGFGDNEVFPVIKSFLVEGLIDGKLKTVKGKEDSITRVNGASIMAFAQGDMIATFMNGIDPNLQRYSDGMVGTILSEYGHKIVSRLKGLSRSQRLSLQTQLDKYAHKLHEKYLDDLGNVMRKGIWGQVVDMVTVLPKDELASMAEALIDLTSLRRRFSGDCETVAGPVDVAVISKGDGMVWIKRKHYFKAEYNPKFLARYFKEENDA
jgi:hypothetical protein